MIFAYAKIMGPSGFEPLTPVLSGLCSNQLSYGPEFKCNVYCVMPLIHYTLHNKSGAIALMVSDMEDLAPLLKN